MRGTDPRSNPAIALMERGEYEGAERLLQQSLTGRASALEHGLLGTVYLLQGRPEEASRHLQRAQALAPHEPEWTEKLRKAAADLVSRSHEPFCEILPFNRDELLAPPPPPALPAPPRPYSPGLVDRLCARAGRLLGKSITFAQQLSLQLAGLRQEADRRQGIWTDWYRKSLFESLLSLSAMRDRLTRENLVNTYPVGALTGFQARGQAVPRGVTHFRTADGSWNNLSNPKEGAAGVRFSRNVSRSVTWPRTGEELLTPNPAEVSQVLLARGARMKEVPFLNLLAAGWLQFMVHDWVGHRMDLRFGVIEVPLPADHPARRKYYQRKMFVGRTAPDPTRIPEDAGTPPTYINEETAWWDGSQIYGSNQQRALQLRTLKGGRLRLDARGMLPVDGKGLEQTGSTRGWWVGLSLMATLFVREHNAICDMLAARYPAWNDDQLYNVARLINAALMAKIHSVEWTPAILPNAKLACGMNSNWYGLAETLLKTRQERRALRPLKVASPVVGGLVGNALENHDVPYALSEEFVEVYRMHDLLPDELEFRRIDDPEALERVSLAEVSHAAVPRLYARVPMADVFFSFGKMHPGALVLNNYPRTLCELSIPGNPVYDLAAVDILRARERGVPRYNEFRRQLGLEPIDTFEDLTDAPEEVAALKRIYQSVEEIDLLIGNRAEAHRPEYFGFGETLFQVFLLNASRRLRADRFYTDSFNAETYSPEGLRWIDENDMKSVLLRHFPELNRTGLANASNAFEPWDAPELLQSRDRHPLRAQGVDA